MMTSAVQEGQEVAIARGSLREALRAIRAAEQKVEVAREVAERASKAVAKARTGVEKFRGLDDQIHQSRVNSLKRGDGDSLPEALKREKQLRGEADEELQASMRVSQSLHGELDAAISEHAGAKKAVENAAAEVVLAELGEIIHELKELNARRHHIQTLIQGVSILYGGAGVHQRIQFAISETLTDTPRMLPADRMPEVLANQFWVDFANRLLVDPETPMPPRPTEKDFWGH
jgi:hypothetical protein